MRVMVLVKEDESSEAGQMPPEDLFVAMSRYNEELVNAGVMLAADGLLPSSNGKRVAFAADGSTTVVDGPFAEAKELIGGFWIWQVASMEEAVEWIKRSPFRGTEIELRPVAEVEDFGDMMPAEARETEARLRAKLAEKK